MLACLVFLGGICKLTLFLYIQSVEPAKIFDQDSRGYMNIARAFVKTGNFAVSPDMSHVPDVIRTPGYPFFLSTFFFLFGENYSPIIITQILLSLGTILITYHIAAIIWKPRIAVISALLLALDLPSFTISQRILTETLFTFVLSIAIILVVYISSKPQHVVFLALSHGICIAVATLIRPVAYYLIIPIIPGFLIILKSYPGLRWKKAGLAAVVLCIPWLIFVGGWQLRNYQITGKAKFSYIQEVNLLFYRGAGIVAQRDNITFRDAQQHLGYHILSKLPFENLAGRIAELSQQWRRKSLQLIVRHPRFLLKDMGRGLAKMMFMPGEDGLLWDIRDYKEKTGPIGDIFHLSLNAYIRKWVFGKTGHFMLFFLTGSYLALFHAGAIFSLWQLIKTRNMLWSVHLFIWFTIIYFIVVSVGPEAYYRFRIPIMPLLSVYAGHGLYQAITALKGAKHDPISHYRSSDN